MLILKRCINIFNPPKLANKIINPSDKDKLIFVLDLVISSLALIIILLKMLEILIQQDINVIDIIMDSIFVLCKSLRNRLSTNITWHYAACKDLICLSSSWSFLLQC